nr:MAG TPA: hypothetical protein [Caudoviricetes sp.]
MSLTSSPVITVEFKISVKNNGYQRRNIEYLFDNIESPFIFDVSIKQRNK